MNKDTYKVYCTYCDALWDAEMMEKLDLSEGSYTPDCVCSRIHGQIDITCSNCKKLVYRKEVSNTLDGSYERAW